MLIYLHSTNPNFKLNVTRSISTFQMAQHYSRLSILNFWNYNGLSRFKLLYASLMFSDCMWVWYFVLTLLKVSLMFPVSRPEALLSDAICEAKSSNTVLTSTINPFSWNRAKCQWSKPKWHHNREEQAFVKQFWY